MDFKSTIGHALGQSGRANRVTPCRRTFPDPSLTRLARISISYYQQVPPKPRKRLSRRPTRKPKRARAKMPPRQHRTTRVPLVPQETTARNQSPNPSPRKTKENLKVPAAARNHLFKTTRTPVLQATRPLQPTLQPNATPTTKSASSPVKRASSYPTANVPRASKQNPKLAMQTATKKMEVLASVRVQREEPSGRNPLPRRPMTKTGPSKSFGSLRPRTAPIPTKRSNPSSNLGHAQSANNTRAGKWSRSSRTRSSTRLVTSPRRPRRMEVPRLQLFSGGRSVCLRASSTRTLFSRSAK